MSEIEDRRQRAREAAHDVNGDPCEVDAQALDAAIETATQVKITPEIFEAAYLARHASDRSDATGLIAAFRAAGFEVIE